MIFLIEFLHIYIYIYCWKFNKFGGLSQPSSPVVYWRDIFSVFTVTYIPRKHWRGYRGAAPTSDAAQRGCDGWCHCQDIGAASEFFFFFFHFWICADSRRLGPICANLDRIGLYQPAKNDRFRSIPALNQAEIQVKIIIFLKKVQKHL